METFTFKLSDETDDIAEFNESIGSDSGSGETAALPRSRKNDDVKSLDASDYHSWGVIGNDQYVANSKTIDHLPPAYYKMGFNQQDQLVFMKMTTVTDNLFLLADTVSVKILDSIEKFWTSKDRFKEYGMLFKRGIMLYGPAGSGKTVTVQLLAEQLIRLGGIVLMCEQPRTTSQALKTIRRIEPSRPIVNIIEDIDTVIENFGEQDVLPMLDGENQVDNIVHIATTNYPERLDARLVNRPSRFDEVRKIDMPKAEIRKAYIQSVLEGKSGISAESLEQWVRDTEGMSIAHLRELVVAVKCLERDYESTIKRLRTMINSKPKSNNTGGNGAGFKSKAQVCSEDE